MEPIPLTIVGAGSIRCGPGLIGSLARYYGERPLEVRLYDADEERLDLFDRLARLVFEDTSVEHSLKATSDLDEALEGAKLVVLALDENCAQKFLRQEGQDDLVEGAESRRLAVECIVSRMPDEALLLSLLPSDILIAQNMYYRVSWPPPLNESERRAVPLQILRWLHREEPFFDLLDANDRSPFKQWLDDPSTAEPIIGSIAPKV